jgi:membrane protease YdiL (CAAX protease family)
MSLRFSILLWCVGMLGVIAMTTLVLPELLTKLPAMLGRPAPPVPVWLLCVASLAQSAVLLGLAVWLGSVLAPRVGLTSPAIEAIVERRSPWPVLRTQAIPGVIGALLGGAVLVAFTTFAPAELRSAQNRLSISLAPRVLYGGLTEEILLRWGVMTFLVWLPHRLSRQSGAPRAMWFWLAIVISAVLFGAGHLPAAGLLAGKLTASIAAWVIAANALFGIVAGLLYWRRGLEAAMIAHAGAHVVGYLIVR